MKYDKAQITDYYEKRDGDGSYEQDWGYTNPVAAAYWSIRDELVMATLAAYFEVPFANIRILEVGAGHGHELAKLSRFGVPQRQLTGIDLLSERLLKAKSIYPGIAFFQQDVTELAFPDSSFDVVCQFTCIMHLSSQEAQEQACREMFRVLKPGGVLLWWDIVPTRWSVLVVRRLCAVLSGGLPLRNILGLLRRTLLDILNKTYRLKSLESSLPIHVHPVSTNQLRQLFPHLQLDTQIAGLDYDIWNFLFRRNRLFAMRLWYQGLLGQHCFAVAKKG